MGWVGVETNQGAAMIAELAGGEHTLTITKVTVGSGYVADINMRTATALKTEKMDGAIVRKESITGGIKLQLRVLAASSLVGAFTMHEMGVWGKLDNGTEKLIVLCQDSVTGVDVPEESTSSEFKFDLFVPLVISNTDNLTVTISTSVFVTNADMVSYVDDAVADKADKVTGATTGNFAALDATGNLTDSGKKSSDFAAPTETLQLTALANGWSNADPPTQTIAATGVTGKEIGVGYGVLTSSQFEEAMNAMIWCTAQGTNEITLTCFGEVPTIDLPITVFIFG